MQGIHSQSYNSGWTENTAARRSLLTTPASRADVLRVLPAIQVPWDTCVREKRDCLDKETLRRKSNRSGITPSEESDLWDHPTRRQQPSWSYSPIPSPSQGWKQQVSSHSPSESKREEVEMTVISLMSTMGLGTCVGGSQVNPMTSTSSPALAGPVPCSWSWGWPAAPSQHTPLPVPQPHQPLPWRLGHVWDTFRTHLGQAPHSQP